MITLLLQLLRLLPSLFGGHRQLALENLALRQQLTVYKRTVARPRLRKSDRLFWVGLARVCRLESVPRDRDAGHRPAVAAATRPRVLDEALRRILRRSPTRQRRDQRAGLPHGRRESPLGCPANPCRAPQARHQAGRTHRLQPPP